MTGQVEFKYTIIGIIHKTCRFPGLFDFQYLPDPHDPLIQLRRSMAQLDVDAIRQFEWPTTHPLVAYPPLRFCSYPIPHTYKDRQSRQVRPLGQASTRLKILVQYFDPSGTIPSGPHPDLEQAEMDPLIVKLLDQIKLLFLERPIWTRMALLGHLVKLDDFSQVSETVLSRTLSRALVYIAYAHREGPWRRCWVPFGLDPRTDKKYRLYQTMDLRMNERDQDRVESFANDPHLFVHDRSTGIHLFQMIDIKLPELEKVIQTITSTCTYTDRYGWYTESAFEYVRLKMKQTLGGNYLPTRKSRSLVFKDIDGIDESSSEHEDEEQEEMDFNVIDPHVDLETRQQTQELMKSLSQMQGFDYDQESFDEFDIFE